jgi:hypothetical protein
MRVKRTGNQAKSKKPQGHRRQEVRISLSVTVPKRCDCGGALFPRQAEAIGLDTCALVKNPDGTISDLLVCSKNAAHIFMVTYVPQRVTKLVDSNTAVACP